MSQQLDGVLTDMQLLIDRSDIADVVSGLAHAQDDKDWEAFRRLFTEQVHFDASRHLDHPAVDLTADELTDIGRAALTGFASTQHVTSNVVITVDGDIAHCRATMTAYHHLPTEPGMADYCTMRGFWDLALRRVDGRWLISRVTVVRTAPFEGYAGLYQIAAAAAAATAAVG